MVESLNQYRFSDRYILNWLYNLTVIYKMWYICSMSTLFDALADPTRRHILDLLRERPRTVNDLVVLVKMSQPGISKHLRVLREAGLVTVRQDAQRRWYEIRAAPLAELDDWLKSYRHLWESNFERLDDYLQRLQDEPPDEPV